MIVEPCCFRKQLTGLLASGREVIHFFTWGDVSLTDFLDYFAGISPGCDVFLSLVGVEESTLCAVAKLMERKDREGNPLIRSFTLLSQGKERQAISNLLGKYRRSGRLLVCEDKVSFRCMAIGSETAHYVLNGSINQLPVFSMQMFTLTTSDEAYEECMSVFNSKKRVKSVR